MWELLKSVIDSLWTFIEPYKAEVIIGLSATVTLALLIRFVGAWMIREAARRKQKLTHEQFKAKAALLALDAISERYAPGSQYVREIREDEKAWKFAWLSPYSRAVKASIKRTKTPKEKKLDARKQIADAAKQITISNSNSNRNGATEGEYEITFKLDGHSPDDFRKLEDNIKGQLGLHTLREIETKDAFSIRFRAFVNEPQDPLTKHKVGAEFFTEHPAKLPYSLPLAVKEDGKAWSLATHHTLIYGTTGSGKGSVINGVIQQLAPYVKNGRCQFYGIDPKASELRPYAESSLFRDIVYETEDAQAVIATIHKGMKQRSLNKKVDLANAQLGRSLEATRETPMVVLFIDEMLSLLIALKQLGKGGAATVTLLTEVLAQGRSLGIYVIGATQSADTELLGRMRGNFANKVVLRQESVYFNDMFLGEDAAKKGYDSTAIPLSSKANNYAYAGIGFAQEESGAIAKVRFAYCSDRDIANLIQAFPLIEEFEDFSEERKAEDDNGDWGYDDDLELPSLDDF